MRAVGQTMPPPVPGNFLARRMAMARNALANRGGAVAMAAVGTGALSAGAGHVPDPVRCVARADLRAALAVVATECTSETFDPKQPHGCATRLAFRMRMGHLSPPWNTDAMDLAHDALLDAGAAGGVDLRDPTTLRPAVEALFDRAERAAEVFLLEDGSALPPLKPPTLAMLKQALEISVSQRPVRLRLPGYGIVGELLSQPRGTVGSARHIREWRLLGRTGVRWFGIDLGLIMVGPTRTHKQAALAFARMLRDEARGRN